MAVYTDVPGHAATMLAQAGQLRFSPVLTPEPEVRPVLEALFDDVPGLHSAAPAPAPWRYVLVRDDAPASQYDRLIELARTRAEIPHFTVCLARSGRGFHGSHGRPWSAQPGNIHLTMHLAPDREIARFETAFTTLAAVSVVDAIDAIAGLERRAAIKWVNDVLIDGAKVAGVLAYTQTMGGRVTSVILGIGLNVETAPRLEATPFVTRAGCLRDVAAERDAFNAATVLSALLGALASNYATLLVHGYRPLIEKYRARSAVIGRDVTICSEPGAGPATVLASGRVLDIGDGLELVLSGRDEPVRRGRLMFATPQQLEKTDLHRTAS